MRVAILRIRGRIVPPASFHSIAIISAPNDHFTAGPHCRVIKAGIGCVGVGGCPTVGAWMIFSTGVKLGGNTLAAPDDHFTACPHSGVTVAGSGRVGDAGACPSVRARIISPAGVEIIEAAIPLIHPR